MTDLSDLIARLEAATEGSRELSDEVLRACGWTTDWLAEGSLHPTWHAPGCWPKGSIVRPDVSRSLDDALALVPEGWRITVIGSTFTGSPSPRWRWLFQRFGLSGGEPYGEAATPALALCAAILRAMEAGRE